MTKQPSLILITVLLGYAGTVAHAAYNFNAPQNPNSRAVVINNGGEMKFKPSSVLSYEERPLSAVLPTAWCQAREADGSVANIAGGVFWKLTDPPVKYKTILDNFSQKIELRWNHTKINETGKYRCDLYNTVNDITHYYASGDFSVTVRPVFHFNHTAHGYKVSDKDDTIVIGERVTISKGDTAILHCRAIAYPSPAFRWYKNTDDEDGRKAIESNANIVQRADHSLEIHNATTDHSGTYYCVVNNTILSKVGEEERNVTYTSTVLYEVYVKGPLQWIIPLVIILIMAILLFAIIYGCGFIKRCRSYNVEKREKRQTKTTDPHAASSDIRSQEPMLKHERDT